MKRREYIKRLNSYISDVHYEGSPNWIDFRDDFPNLGHFDTTIHPWRLEEALHNQLEAVSAIYDKIEEKLSDAKKELFKIEPIYKYYLSLSMVSSGLETMYETAARRVAYYEKRLKEADNDEIDDSDYLPKWNDNPRRPYIWWVNCNNIAEEE